MQGQIGLEGVQVASSGIERQVFLGLGQKVIQRATFKNHMLVEGVGVTGIDIKFAAAELVGVGGEQPAKQAVVGVVVDQCMQRRTALGDDTAINVFAQGADITGGAAGRGSGGGHEAGTQGGAPAQSRQ